MTRLAAGKTSRGAERLADAIPDVRLTLVEGAGHFLAVDHFEVILAALAAASRA